MSIINKKQVLTLLMAMGVGLGNSHADTVLGVYAGAQAWNMSTSGSFSDESEVGAFAQVEPFNFDSQSRTSFYVALEHLVPVIPNIKLQRTQMDTSGLTTLTGNFVFGGELYTTDTQINTQVDLVSTDIILYYEILDTDVFSFDVGVNGKVVDGNFNVLNSDSNTSSSEDFTGLIPMLYSRVEVGLPFTGLGAYAEGSFLAIDDNTASDYQIALTYSFVESLAIDMSLQLGYREVSVELDGLDDINSDLSFDGAFAGIEWHF